MKDKGRGQPGHCTDGSSCIPHQSQVNSAPGVENPIEPLAPAEEVKTNSLFLPMRDAKRALMFSSQCLKTEAEPVEAGSPAIR
jgi:hypothetical protein